MTVSELKNMMDLFKKFTMKEFFEDGKVRDAEDFIFIENGNLDRLIKQMRYINKILGPAFVRDWCLKCCRYLNCTSPLFKAFSNSN